MQTARSHAIAPAARVLVVADDAAAIAPVCAELVRRGGVIARALTTLEAAKLARAQTFDYVVIYIRPETASLLLLVPLLRNEAAGSPRISILVDPESAESVSRACPQADALLSSELPAAHIAESVGFAQAEPEFLPPAVVKPARLTILALPSPLPREFIPDDVAQSATRGTVPDAVVITEPAGAHLITAWMSAAAAAVVPVIDATGQTLAIADARVASPTPHGLAHALREIEAIQTRMRALPEAYFRSADPRTMLLARLAVRDRGCEPKRDPTRASTFNYADERVVANLLPTAESLVRSGHLDRRFFDRLQCCPGCASARVLVREECSKCRSGDIADEAIIHHLRCGYQGPERDFRQASRLVCPKCRNHLEHFSVDYDKPGRLFICNDCGQTTGDTSVGFTCIDCNDRHDTAAMQTRTVHGYVLTDTGREAAFLPPMEKRGAAPLTETNPIRTSIARFVQAQKAGGAPYAVLFIRLDPTGEAQASAGAKHWLETRSLFESVLRELFADSTEIVHAGDSFLALIADTTADKVATSLPHIRQELEKNLRYPIGARYDVLTPDLLEKFV